MAFDQERLGPELPHRVVLEDRSRLTVSGVEEVERFDENTVVLSTAQGGLRSRGRGCTSKSCHWTGGACRWRGR